MTEVLKADCHTADAYVSKTVTLPSAWWIQADIGAGSAGLAALVAATDNHSADLINIVVSPTNEGFYLGDKLTTASLASPTSVSTELYTGTPVANTFPADAMNRVILHYDGTTMFVTVGGRTLFSYAVTIASGSHAVRFGGINALHVASEFYYVTNVKIGTSEGGTDIFHDDFASGNTSAWTTTTGSATVIADPFVAVTTAGRVFIAFDDTPLEPDPTWTRIDDPTGVTFPKSFVSGYDVTAGRQTLLAQTDTGTANVYINDRSGLFDHRNASSPYYGKLDGKQIMLQLLNPVTGLWESQFRGHIDDWQYDINGEAVDASGNPINASIQINCVDVFDYLAGFGLTPGLAGIRPPAGMEDGVIYAETQGSVDDRFIEILADVGIDYTRSVIFSGNMRPQAVKYDPDESALAALRDAADAEIPFIANLYVDRQGRVCFHGRYSRFVPDAVAAGAGDARWDFNRWPLGDGKAIQADSTRGQLRILTYTDSRSEIINIAVAYPANMAAANMPNQVYADSTSVNTYGQHAAPPMSDLLVRHGIQDNTTGNAETLLYAELLVKNQKDPRISVSTIQLKSIQPTDPRAAATWGPLTRADVSDIVNIAVGYPGGTGLAGASPADDYFIEGRQIRVRPSGTDSYDYVELDLNLSPFEWSADTHSVFPPRG